MGFAVGIPLALQLASTISADEGYLAALNLSSRDSIATLELKGGTTPNSYQDLQDRAIRAVGSTTGPRMAAIGEYSTISSFTIRSLNGGEFPLEQLPPLKAAFYPALEQKARLFSGSWPAPANAGDPVQATVAEQAALLYAWKVGDLVCLASADDTATPPAQTCVRITGIWRPSVSSDPFWLAEPPISAIDFRSDGYWAFAQRTNHVRVIASRVYRPDPERLIVAEAPALESGIRRLRSSLRYGGDDLLTSLDQTIAAFLDRAVVNSLPVQLVGAELVLVVLFGVAFLTQSFLVSQATETTLWRIRGWSRGDVARFIGTQLLLLAVPAILLGSAAAIAATWWQASRYGLDPHVLVSDVTSGLGPGLGLSALGIAAVCLALTTRFSWRTVSQMRRGVEPFVTPWWRARNIDLALAVIALPLLAEAAMRGQAAVRAQQQGLDVIGLALPIVALSFLAVASLRLIPLLVQPIRLLAQNVSGRLTWWRLSRQPAEHAGAAVLLSLTLAVGLFASTYDATETSNAADRAAYAVGADLRISFTPQAGPQGIRNEVAGISGVNANTSVLRERVQIASSSEAVTALALDPLTFSSASWSRPGLTTPALGPALVQMSGSPSSVTLPDQPTELRIWVDGLRQPATLEAVVRDASGQVCTCSFGSLQFSDWRQLHAQIAFPQAARFPLRVELLRVHGPARVGAGTVDLAVFQSVSSSGVATIDDFANVTGWWARDPSGLVMAPGASGPQRGGASTVDIAVPANGDISLYPPFREDGLPFLMAQPTMARLALRPGDRVALAVDSHQIVGKLVGPIDYVPTLYPGSEDFIVLALDRTVSAFAAALNESQTPNEMWLAMKPQGVRATQGLGPDANISFAVNRQHEQSVAASDPTLIQLRANLATAFVAALLLAFLGFAVHFIIAARRRLAEHAILEANGLEPNDVRRGIAIEQALIALFAFVVGAGLAGIASAALLPSLGFGPTPAAVIPPTVVRIDWRELLVALLIAAGFTALVAWLTRRFAGSVDVVQEIRRLG